MKRSLGSPGPSSRNELCLTLPSESRTCSDPLERNRLIRPGACVYRDSRVQSLEIQEARRKTEFPQSWGQVRADEGPSCNHTVPDSMLHRGKTGEILRDSADVPDSRGLQAFMTFLFQSGQIPYRVLRFTQMAVSEERTRVRGHAMPARLDVGCFCQLQ